MSLPKTLTQLLLAKLENLLTLTIQPSEFLCPEYQLSNAKNEGLLKNQSLMIISSLLYRLPLLTSRM